MANFQNVFEFLKNVPAARQHEEIYYRVLDKAKQGQVDDIDLNDWERTTVGVGEMNLLHELQMSDKFVCRDMDKSFKLNSIMLSKQKEKAMGKGSLDSEKDYVESYLMEDAYRMEPMRAVAESSGRAGIEIRENYALYRQLVMSMGNMDPAALTGVYMSFVGERMVLKSDLRHLFLKGYLYLMSYNLAVISDYEDIRYKDINAHVKAGISADEKMHCLVASSIVIEASQFTPDELWFLAVMGDEYPKRKYGDDNIYNNIAIEADDVIFVSGDRNFKFIDDPGFHSPEGMWNDLVNIAIKLHAMDDLHAVVKDMRGVPGLMREMVRVSERYCYTITYPLSRSIVSAVEELNVLRPSLRRNIGYYATSECVVADLVLSKMLFMSCYNIIEEIGALSTVGCPTGDPKTDKLFNSNLSNLGLRQDDEGENYLLQEWRAIKGCEMVITFSGRLKKFVVNMAEELYAGKYDLLRPQLLHAMPYSACRNTTWATGRG